RGLEGVDQERARAFVFCVIPTEVEGPRISELRNGSQIFKKWSEMVLCCWGFHKNVSRETFLVQENESRIVTWRDGSLRSAPSFTAVLKLTLGRHQRRIIGTDAR